MQTYDKFFIGGEWVEPAGSDTLKVLSKKPAFWHMAMGGAITSFVGYGVGGFLPPFLMRVQSFKPDELAQGIFLCQNLSCSDVRYGSSRDRRNVEVVHGVDLPAPSAQAFAFSQRWAD